MVEYSGAPYPGWAPPPTTSYAGTSDVRYMAAGTSCPLQLSFLSDSITRRGGGSVNLLCGKGLNFMTPLTPLEVPLNNDFILFLIFTEIFDVSCNVYGISARLPGNAYTVERGESIF